MTEARIARTMPDETDRDYVTGRRNVLAAAAGTAAAGFTVGLGAAKQDLPQEFVLEQDGECYPATPLSGDVPVEELYGWDLSDYSATGLVDLQRDDASVMFLYDGPRGLSLVLVHDRFDATEPATGDRGGGSASFTFSGLPESGEWAVQDDRYDGSTNYDRWSRDGETARVDWTWAGNRTDGGAFRGLDREFELSIAPAFNEAAALDGEYYEGRITDWQLVSGSLDRPERYSLGLDSEVTIARGTCPGGDTGLPVTGTEDDEGGADGDERGPPWADDDEGGPPFDDDGKPGHGPGDGRGNGDGGGNGRGRQPGFGLGFGRASLDPLGLVSRIFGR